MIKPIWDSMQVVDIYEKAYLGLNVSFWYIKLILDAMQVVDVNDKVYLRLDESCWYIW